MTQMVMSWCPGDPCDPCKKIGNIEIVGNTGIGPGHPGTNALGFARGSIILFPEFPVTVTATINLKGIYRPFVGYIDSDGGSVNLAGTSDNVQVLLPLGSTFLQAVAGWNPSGSDLLHFNVVATSSTTSLGTIGIATVNVVYHPNVGSPIDVSSKTRWTGNVE